jgi:hypothetical protein
MVIRVMLIGACGLTLAGCASYLPSISGFFQSSPKTEQLRIESDPEGAEAKSSEGATCQTPCELSVPSGSDFSITMSMVGYQTLTGAYRSGKFRRTSTAQSSICQVAAVGAPIAGKKTVSQKEIDPSSDRSIVVCRAAAPSAGRT